MKQTPHHEPSVVVLYMQPATAQGVWEGKVTWCSYLVHVQMTCSYESYMVGPKHMKPFVTSVADKFKEVALHGRCFLPNVEGIQVHSDSGEHSDCEYLYRE